MSPSVRVNKCPNCGSEQLVAIPKRSYSDYLIVAWSARFCERCGVIVDRLPFLRNGLGSIFIGAVSLAGFLYVMVRHFSVATLIIYSVASLVSANVIHVGIRSIIYYRRHRFV